MSRGACVEIKQLEDETEKLRQEKQGLVIELVRLKQHQQGTEFDLQSLEERLQVMEQRQHRMMAFLDKAVQIPTLWHSLFNIMIRLLILLLQTRIEDCQIMMRSWILGKMDVLVAKL